MAMVDMFLKIDTVKGESQDDKHKDEIDIMSFSFGVSQQGVAHTGGGSGAGKAAWDDMVIVKRADKSSPSLMLRCANGQHFKDATLTVRKAGGKQEEYYTVKMYEVLISSFNNQGSGDDAIPVEHVSLNYSKIEFTYKVQNKDGSTGSPITTKWDIKTNKGG